MSASLAEREPIHLPFQEWSKQIMWDIPGSGDWGFQRGRSPVIELEGLDMYTLVIPIGQGAPETADETDTCFVGASGEVVIESEGQRYVVGPKDVLCVAAGTPYTLRNIVLDTALLFTTHARPDKTGTLRMEEGDFPSVIHQPWSESRSQFHWDLPMGNEWGNHVGSGPHLQSKHFRGHLVQHPIGQSRPWHATARDVAFFGFDGVVEWHAAGKLWPVQRFDMFALRARTPYLYNNVGLEHGLFWDIGSINPPGEHAIYWAGDPGWPIRKNAGDIELETVTGFEGERRLVPKGSKA